MYFRESPGSLCLSQMSITQQKGLDNIYVQKQKLQSRRGGKENDQKEKKLERKKCEELRNITGN